MKFYAGYHIKNCSKILHMLQVSINNNKQQKNKKTNNKVVETSKKMKTIKNVLYSLNEFF